ncbi:hypothetical protein EVAR_50877_1 [Eumeta japonica]|uniref:Uncharacterized protein n=1 Tax=Eumeta variegata TaxID=151549 RepID=A0A4C1Y3J0_EUMVA|nr:hypothetical protein EVAR_50877_1 [Eumeta japonica]
MRAPASGCGGGRARSPGAGRRSSLLSRRSYKFTLKKIKPFNDAGGRIFNRSSVKNFRQAFACGLNHLKLQRRRGDALLASLRSFVRNQRAHERCAIANTATPPCAVGLPVNTGVTRSARTSRGGSGRVDDTTARERLTTA